MSSVKEQYDEKAQQDVIRDDAVDKIEFEDQHYEETGLHESDAALANAPWKYKMIALATALMLPVGSHFSGAALGAMKASLKENLMISNTRYGVLSSSVSIINTVFPVLGGFFIDTFGTVWGTLVINFMILLGSLLTAIAAHVGQFPLMVVGQVVFGIGSGLIVTMQESLLSKWFRTKYLALAIGMQLSISRLSTFLGTLVSNPISERMDDWVWAFWLALILCGFSIIMNLIYAYVLHHLQGAVVTKTEILRIKAKKTVHVRSLLKFPPYFWHIILIEFIFAAVWTVHQSVATELVQIHFGTTQKLAAYKASVSQVVPIVVTPILGVFIDLVGQRVKICKTHITVLLSAAFFVISCGLLGWTYVEPIAGMILYSFSLAFGPITMITSIGMILPSDYIGTGLGLFKSSNNIGSSILDIIVGIVQDNTEGEKYTGVMTVFVILGCVGFMIICGLYFTQRIYLKNLLELGRSKREERMTEINDKELFLTKQGLDSLNNKTTTNFNYFAIGIYVFFGICAWVLFFVFAVTGKASAREMSYLGLLHGQD
ncbi:major facilitator superfamily domain-containing protein [Zychaea mexicana]|uniref:major facilitator superfamily domain-containing protein n=1 Tax=Zychaea mexicana TaxID=64656 RepID=UPI0022FEBB3D|nr:major facilitator superfamily domain-containing protein [Zychaea mexicana]KAI9498264.1 major facilitator superfamily domain-containing protein [Zychaea mexicana]